MHGQTQGANPRDVKPADLQALSHSCFGHVVLPVGLPHAQPILSLPPRKPCGRRLERRWLDALDQAVTAIVDHQLPDFLTQEASRETRQAFRLPVTTGFVLAHFPIDGTTQRNKPLIQSFAHPNIPGRPCALQTQPALPPAILHRWSG